MGCYFPYNWVLRFITGGGHAVQAKITFPTYFPVDPPLVYILRTSFWHPNVNEADGKVTIHVLDAGWIPNYDIRSILSADQRALSEPDPLHVSNEEAAAVLQEGREEYDRRFQLQFT